MSSLPPIRSPALSSAGACQDNLLLFRAQNSDLAIAIIGAQKLIKLSLITDSS